MDINSVYCLQWLIQGIQSMQTEPLFGKFDVEFVLNPAIDHIFLCIVTIFLSRKLTNKTNVV